MKEDVEHFVGYLSPAFLGMLGGKDSVIRMMQKDIYKIVRAINRYRVGTPTKIFKTSSDLQCLISDTVVYEMTPTIIEQELALSTDGGSHWVFINAGVAIGNLAQFKSLLPTLAPEAEAELKRRMNVK